MNPSRPSDRDLRIAADQLRLDCLRGLAGPGNGHVGGIFSMAELLAVLYGCFVRTDPSEPKNPERDKVVLSKGHCGPGLFAALAARGFFPASDLTQINANGTRFPSHCDMNKTPGVDMTTGSLGQGASSAAGLALADRLSKRDFTTYLILGDGELNEGQVWEMALFARQNRLGNLVAFVDANGQQLDGAACGICDMGNITEKFRAFGWDARHVPNGHDVGAIRDAVDAALTEKDLPSAIVLDTVKGKGWTQLEGKCPVHHSVITAESLEQAEKEIGGRIAALRQGA